MLPLMNSPLAPVQMPLEGTEGASQVSKVLDTMRAYRACLHCRNRKSKCDLDPNQGKPPCRRCQRENRECVLGESHRGGRRVRKRPRTEDGSAEGEPTTPVNPGYQNSPDHSAAPLLSNFQSSISTPGSHYVSVPIQTPQQHETPTQYNNRPLWQAPSPEADGRATGQSQYPPISSPSHNQQPYHPRLEPTSSLAGKPHEGIASATLQNPSDALEILAQVADRADGSNSPRSDDPSGQAKRRAPLPQPDPPIPLVDTWYYKPIQNGSMSPEMVYQLFASYEQFFHPFFPIIPRETFDTQRIQWLSRHEPHLFSAILTVASKDDERIHQVCYDHMQQLISNILAGADANVEAVEALLLLSQWVSHRPQVASTVGRGEEDRVAWMYIGTALRLGYFLEIDRTSFNGDTQEDPVVFDRKRLVWAACYICDRQVSVRVGKGFWARGPGPLSGLKASDFPTLQPASPHDANSAMVFQAILELTQIFSNVHDILYSSKGHGWREMLEGRYAKYLDDFRYSIKTWSDTWKSLECPAYIKASMLLTYDYLRLYVNAFAYQATMARALTDKRDSQHNPNRSIPLINATAPDARFIYEAIDAATSLLSRFITSVDPQTLRHMPSSYYLFIIYSAVFLYKARSTTSMNEAERDSVHTTIRLAIDRLRASSVGANQMGHRYARLLELLWRKSPKQTKQLQSVLQRGLDNRLSHRPQAQAPADPNFDPNLTYLPHQGPSQLSYVEQGQAYDPGIGTVNDSGSGNSGVGFSWLDLPATFNYALQNQRGTSSGSHNGEEGMGIGAGGDFSPAESGQGAGGYMEGTS
ncbi:C6 zinc finger domain-containing protein [Diplocarpon rosae]|nr:C6 zinc finger domain-containing protein [Diplocarpon rosae]